MHLKTFISPRVIANVLLVVLILSAANVHSQPGNILYFMKGVPQSNLLNPAFQPQCNFYFGIPGVSPFMLNVQSNPVRPHDILFYNASIDSVITFLHPLADKDKFLSIFSNHNYVATDLSTSLFSLGFRIKEMYFTLGISEKAFVRVGYPKDLFRIPIYFALDKNMNPTNLSLSGLGINASAYSEISVGVSKKFTDELTVGVRGKLLLGQANINMRKTDININTSLTQWDLVSKFELDASIPFLQTMKDETGKTRLDTFNFIQPTSKQALDAALWKTNLGMALDLGVEYKPLSWLTVSASLVDFGAIKWKHNVNSLTQDTSYTFHGIDVTGVFTGADTGKIGNKILDTIKNVFKAYNNPNTAYRTILPSKVYLGATFNLGEKVSFGLLSMTEIFQGKVRESVSVSANLMPIKMFSTSFSYSLLQNKYHDVGFGLSLKTGPWNMYYLFDYLPTTFDKYKAKNSNIRFPLPVYSNAFSMKLGFNVVFGCNRKKKQLRDVPLIQ